MKKGQYQQFFSTYTVTMFAQLLLHCKLNTLPRGGILYSKGDLSDHFYYVLKGELHQTFLDEKELRATRTMEAGMIFGFREKED